MQILRLVGLSCSVLFLDPLVVLHRREVILGHDIQGGYGVVSNAVAILVLNRGRRPRRSSPCNTRGYLSALSHTRSLLNPALILRIEITCRLRIHTLEGGEHCRIEPSWRSRTKRLLRRR